MAIPHKNQMLVFVRCCLIFRRSKMEFTLYTANCVGNPQNSLYPDKVEINGADDMRAAVLEASGKVQSSA